MNRFWVRILVFVGLMTAAGVIWGVLEASFFTRSFFFLPTDPPKSNAVWAFPISLSIFLFTLWLAAWIIARDFWKAVAAVLATCPFVYILSLVVSIASVLSGLGFAAFAMLAGAMLLYLVFGIGYLWRSRRRGRLRPSLRECNWRALGASLGVCGGMILVLRLVAGTDNNFGAFHLFGSSGLALVLAWQFGRIAEIDFFRWFGLAALGGGAIGACVGVFLVSKPDRPGAEKEILRNALLGFCVAALPWNLPFAAHAVLLLQMYRVAWNAHAMLVSTLWVCGVLGAIGGLVIACAVHVASAEPERRLSRVPLALALTVPPILIASVWAVSFVRTHDVGRDFLAKAQKLEGQTADINFCSGSDEPPVYQDRGRRIIWVRTSDEVLQGVQRRSCWRTVRLVDELLRRYPESAYRSAALLLRFTCLSSDWQPARALEARGDLLRLYPNAGYTSWGTPRLRMYDLMLLGDYEEVVRLSRERAPRYQTSRRALGAKAAETLGLWDDVIRLEKEDIADLKADTEYKGRGYQRDLARYTARLRRAEQMKAKVVGPRPRTSVIGRVFTDGKPTPGISVCILPAHPSDRTARDMNALYAAGRAGRVAATDADGVYRIERVPSGDYEVVLVLDPRVRSVKYNVRAPGVPYDIKGRSVRLPDIVLTTK